MHVFNRSGLLIQNKVCDEYVNKFLCDHSVLTATVTIELSIRSANYLTLEHALHVVLFNFIKFLMCPKGHDYIEIRYHDKNDCPTQTNFLLNYTQAQKRYQTV